MRALAIITTLLISSAPGWCATIERDGLTVVFPEGLDPRAELVATVTASHSARLLKELGLSLPPESVVILMGESEFARQYGATRSKLFCAFALPGSGTVVLQVARSERGRWRGLSRVLRHELVHLATGELRRRSGRQIPIWFDEGLAMVYGDIPIEMDLDRLLLAAKAGRLVELAKLGRSFASDNEPAVRLAYLESVSAVRRLRVLQGDEGLRRLVAAIAGGATFELAMVQVYGMSLDDFEADWRASLSTGSSFLDWLAILRSGTSLFTWLALLAVVGFIVQMVRRSRRKERMDTEW